MPTLFGVFRPNGIRRWQCAEKSDVCRGYLENFGTTDTWIKGRA